MGRESFSEHQFNSFEARFDPMADPITWEEKKALLLKIQDIRSFMFSKAENYATFTQKNEITTILSDEEARNRSFVSEDQFYMHVDKKDLLLPNSSHKLYMAYTDEKNKEDILFYLDYDPKSYFCLQIESLDENGELTDTYLGGGRLKDMRADEYECVMGYLIKAKNIIEGVIFSS